MRWVIHNLVAHPLLVLCPPLGERLHRLTEPANHGDDAPLAVSYEMPPMVHVDMDPRPLPGAAPMELSPAGWCDDEDWSAGYGFYL
jgi:hypothetical protein